MIKFFQNRRVLCLLLHESNNKISYMLGQFKKEGHIYFLFRNYVIHSTNIVLRLGQTEFDQEPKANPL